MFFLLFSIILCCAAKYCSISCFPLLIFHFKATSLKVPFDYHPIKWRFIASQNRGERSLSKYLCCWMLRVRNILLALSSSRDTGMLASQMKLCKHVMEPCIHRFKCCLAASEIFSDRLKALGIEEFMQTIVLRKIQPNIYLSKNSLGHNISNLTKSFKSRRN